MVVGNFAMKFCRGSPSVGPVCDNASTCSTAERGRGPVPASTPADDDAPRSLGRRQSAARCRPSLGRVRVISRAAPPASSNRTLNATLIAVHAMSAAPGYQAHTVAAGSRRDPRESRHRPRSPSTPGLPTVLSGVASKTVANPGVGPEDARREDEPDGEIDRLSARPGPGRPPVGGRPCGVRGQSDGDPPGAVPHR